MRECIAAVVRGRRLLGLLERLLIPVIQIEPNNNLKETLTVLN